MVRREGLVYEGKKQVTLAESKGMDPCRAAPGDGTHLSGAVLPTWVSRCPQGVTGWSPGGFNVA